MSLEELHDCSCDARGCVRRSVFVFSLYFSRAATKMVRKSNVDVALGRDITVLGRSNG